MAPAQPGPTVPEVPGPEPVGRHLELGRSYVQGDPARFERLLTDQLVPADLVV